jgi:transcriptional regulator with GAF, ATPase, and Fis domain
MSVPLIANGKPIGILFLASVDVGAYGQGHVDIVKHITNAIAITLERAILLENHNSSGNPITSPKQADPSHANGSTEQSENSSTQKTWKDWEMHILTQTLRNCGGKIYGSNGAASILDLPPTTLQGKLKKLGLNRKEVMREIS